MKRIAILTMLVFALVAQFTVVSVMAQEMEIPVVFDRSYLEEMAPTGEERIAWERARTLDFYKSEIALSPDGNWIAFIASAVLSDAGISRDIGVIPVEGGEPTIVYSIPQEQLFRYTPSDWPIHFAAQYGEISNISFTPDSKAVIFCREYYDPAKGSRFEFTGVGVDGYYSTTSKSVGMISTIEKVDIATGEVSTIIEEGSAPNWSPDGRYLSYVHYDHYFFTNPSESRHHGVPAIYDTVTGETRFMTDENATINSTKERLFASSSDWDGRQYKEVLLTGDNTELICIRRTQETPSVEPAYALVRISVETGEESVIPVEVTGLTRYLRNTPGDRYILYTFWDDAVSLKKVMLFDKLTDKTVWAFLETDNSVESGTITPDGNSIIYLSRFDFEYSGTIGSGTFHNASKICRQPIDIEMRFAIGNNPPPELPDDYGVLPEYGTKVSDIDVHRETAPLWSPDGKDLAFVSDWEFTSPVQIYTVPADGGEARLVYENPPIIYQDHPLSIPWLELCGFTPDGSEILFARLAVDEARGSIPEVTPTGGFRWANGIDYLYAVNINTGAVRTVIDGVDIAAVSPDGKYLAYTVPRLDTDPFFMAHKLQTIIRDLETGEETFLDYCPFRRCYWTPDSKAVYAVVTSENATVRLPIDGSEPEVIVNKPYYWDFTITPDARYMVYATQDILYARDTQTDESIQISPEAAGEFSGPELSPDGTKLAYYVKYTGKSLTNPYVSRSRYSLFVTDFDLHDDVTPTAVEDAVPVAELLITNYPNPFNPSTTISFSLPSEGIARLDIFNLSGQKVRELLNGNLAAGMHEVVWDSRSDEGMPLASGMYIARITTGSHVATQRMLLMK